MSTYSYQGTHDTTGCSPLVSCNAGMTYITDCHVLRLQATTRGSPEMVAKWDSQQALKPPAFDQDDCVTSVDGLLEIAVTSRGGRLNSGWKKVSKPLQNSQCCYLYSARHHSHVVLFMRQSIYSCRISCLPVQIVSNYSSHTRDPQVRPNARPEELYLLYTMHASQYSVFAHFQENQDKFMLQMNREDGWTVMGVFDGHGMWGGKVASAVRDGMVRAMRDVDGRKMNGSDPETVLSSQP